MESDFNPIGAIVTVAAGGWDTAATLTPPAGATKCMIQPGAQAVRVTFDRPVTTPTTAIGFLIAVGTIEIVPVTAQSTIKVIAAAAGASANYQWGN